MSVSPDGFRSAMGHLVAGVTVVAIKDDAGRAYGMTASAVSSLSLEPPMVLACIDRSATIHDLLVRSRAFSISILAEDQAELAQRFADPARHQFADAAGPDGPAGPLGLPVVAGALAHLECTRGRVHDGGDHSIITATVEWARTQAGAPLCHFQSSYARLAR